MGSGSFARLVHSAFTLLRSKLPHPSMTFRTPVHIEPLARPIDHNRAGLALGSCFATQIGTRMARAKLPLTINPFGIQFNPASIASGVERLRSGVEFGPEDLLRSGEMWVSLHHHGSFSAADPDEALRAMNRAFAAGREALERADYLLITLGTAWVYEYRASGSVVNNCHRLPAADFTRRRLPVDEVAACLERIRKASPGKQLIVTVSPVRHPGDGLVQNQLSKSTLIAAAGAMAERCGEAEYFPAYEILMDELRDYRFYAPDMLHPSEVAVDYIWGRFCATALSAPARELAERIERLQSAAAHRPINPGGETHRTFLQKMRAEASALQAEYPHLDFSPEIEAFSR